MGKHRLGSFSFGKGKGRFVFSHMNKPIGHGLIGMVRSNLFPYPVAIVIDDTQAEDKDYFFACLACAENGTVPRILIDRELFYDIIRGSNLARVILLHELGHYYHEHLSSQGENRDKARIDFASAGVVDPNELEADLFVTAYLGKEKTIAGLNELMEEICIEYADYDKDSLLLAVKELQLRIAALEDYTYE